MIVPVMAISNLLLTRQIYSEETNGAHGHYREPLPSIIVVRFCEWFAPCKLKATVKWTTKTLSILPSTFEPVSQQIRLVQVACILGADWKKLRRSCAIRGSYVTCCKTSLPWAGKTSASCTDFLAKSRTTLYFRQQLSATCNKLICCKTDLIRRW